MLSFAPLLAGRRAPRLLFLGAHSDDAEIGCGGTVLELARRYPAARVCWVVFAAQQERGIEARRSARALLRGFRHVEIVLGGFRDGFFPQQYGAIKEFCEQLKRQQDPDLIFSHTLADRHQDHRTLAELTWNTWRNHAVLEYEIPKYEGDLGHPNVYVAISAAQMRRKVAHLMRHFATQRSRRWFTPDTFQALLRLRGIECNAPEGYAEAFHGRKILL